MLAIDIAYYWSSEYSRARLNVRRLYHFTRLQAKAHFVNLEALIAAIPPTGETSNSYTLSQLVQAGQLKIKLEEEALAKHWEWFVGLIGSTSKYPFKLLLQVISLFTTEVELSFRTRERRLNERFAALLIPDTKKRLDIFRIMRDSWMLTTDSEKLALNGYQKVYDDLHRILAP